MSRCLLSSPYPFCLITPRGRRLSVERLLAAPGSEPLRRALGAFLRRRRRLRRPAG